MIRALFIEVLGTLLDIHDIERHIAEFAAREIPVRISGVNLIGELVNEIRNRISSPSNQYKSMKNIVKDSIAIITKKYNMILSPNEIYYITNKAINALVNIARPHWDVEPFLQGVRDMGMPIYILTNLDNDTTRKILISLNLTEHFSGIISADLSKAAKPNIKIYFSALRRAGVKPEESILISALPEDVIGGALCNIFTIFVKRGQEVPRNAQIVVENLVEAVEHLRKMGT